MKINGYLTILFAFLLLIGGLIGYFVAHSVASLVMSSIFALLLFIAAGALLNLKPWGNWLALAVCITLFGFFSYRFSLNPMPRPGLLALLSLALAAKLYFTSDWKFKR